MERHSFLESMSKLILSMCSKMNLNRHNSMCCKKDPNRAFQNELPAFLQRDVCVTLCLATDRLANWQPKPNPGQTLPIWECGRATPTDNWPTTCLQLGRKPSQLSLLLVLFALECSLKRNSYANLSPDSMLVLLCLFELLLIYVQIAQLEIGSDRMGCFLLP